MKQLRILFLSVLIVSSCSKEKENEVEHLQLEQLAFPEQIILEYTDETVEYHFTYSEDNQIQQLYVKGYSQHFGYQEEAEFIYNDQGLLVEVNSIDLNIMLQRQTTFSYDLEQNMEDIKLFWNSILYESSLFYNSATNSYTIDGEFGFLPIDWNFDSNNRLVQLNISSNTIRPTYEESEKGMFYNVPIQPAHHLWFGLRFSNKNIELSYFGKTGIANLITDELNYQYQNKVFDENGNPIAFEVESPDGNTIKYTVEYTNKALLNQ